MKSLRAFRKLNFKKTGFAMLGDDIEIPVRTLSIAEENSIKLNIPFGIPTKIEKLSEADKRRIMEEDKNYNPSAYPACKIYDMSSKEYIEYEEAKVKYDPILSGIKYIDFNYKYEDGLTFLQNLENTGLPKQGDKINWLQVCRYFEELGITDKCLASIITTAKALQGDTVFEKINKLSKITDMDYIELLTKIENIVDLERDFHEQEMEIERLNEIIDNLSKLSIKENVVDSLNQEQTDQVQAEVETVVNE